jgi:hypothetical protein
MTRYDGLELGRKMREFSTKEEAESWKARHPKLWRGKRLYTIRKTRLDKVI